MGFQFQFQFRFRFRFWFVGVVEAVVAAALLTVTAPWAPLHESHYSSNRALTSPSPALTPVRFTSKVMKA